MELHAIQLADCTVDLTHCQVLRDGSQRKLTRQEVQLLRYLAQRPGDVVSRNELLREVWGYTRAPTTRSVDQAIGRLRAKVESDPDHPVYIRTVRGTGYRFDWSAPTTAPGNLTAEPTPWVGRARELSALLDLVDSERLVTVVGPPGAGKTRIAREVGRSVHYEGGVWFCDLSNAHSPAEVRAVVAGTLQIKVPMGGTLLHGLSQRPDHLLLLDNFEQAVAAAPQTVAPWLGAAPGLHVLVTSRERLRLPGEACFDLEPLDVDDAVALFMDRARRSRSSFDGPLPVITEIVERLDRLPLAIELTAGRVALLSAEGIRDRLGRSLALVAGGPRGVPGRQRALRNALDTSWEVLSETERAALAMCTVFRGGFSVEAGEAVVGPDGIDSLQALRERSLLRFEPTTHRVSMYDSVRHAAAERLDELGLREVAEARHATWFLEAGERLLFRRDREGSSQAAAALAAEADNLRAVVARTAGRIPQLATRALALLARARMRDTPLDVLALLDEGLGYASGPDRVPLLQLRGEVLRAAGHLAEAVADLSQARELASGGPPGPLSEVLGDLADTLIECGRFDEGRAVVQAAIPLAQQAGDRVGQGRHHRRLAVLDYHQNALAEGLQRIALAIELLSGRGGARSHLAGAYGIYGLLSQRAGDNERARALYEQAAALCRELGEARFEAAHIGNLGSLLLDLGDTGRAEQCQQQALALAQRLGLRRLEANCWGNLALNAVVAQRYDQLQRRAERGLFLAREMQAEVPEAGCLMALGLGALVQGDAREGLARLRAAWKLARVARPAFSGVIAAFLAAAEATTGDREAAAEHWRWAREHADDETRALCDILDPLAGESAEEPVGTWASLSVARRLMGQRTAEG